MASLNCKNCLIYIFKTIIKRIFPYEFEVDVNSNNDNDEKADKICSMHEHPGSDIALDEIRILFQLEEIRRQGIITKTSILLALDSIIAGFAISYLSISYDFFHILGYIALLTSFFYGTFIIKLEKNYIPHQNVNNFFHYAKKEPSILKKRFILNYIMAMNKFSYKNNLLVMRYQNSFIMFIVSIISFAVYLLL